MYLNPDFSGGRRGSKTRKTPQCIKFSTHSKHVIKKYNKWAFWSTACSYSYKDAFYISQGLNYAWLGLLLLQ